MWLRQLLSGEAVGNQPMWLLGMQQVHTWSSSPAGPSKIPRDPQLEAVVARSRVAFLPVLQGRRMGRDLSRSQVTHFVT